jgi:hypothetical protein
MIVKSMSRKTPSFGQLIGYIDRDEGQEAYRIRHNLLGRGQGRVRSEFERNSDLLAKRKNGVYLYHEIISITRARGLSAKEQKGGSTISRSPISPRDARTIWSMAGCTRTKSTPTTTT